MSERTDIMKAQQDRRTARRLSLRVGGHPQPPKRLRQALGRVLLAPTERAAKAEAPNAGFYEVFLGNCVFNGGAACA